MRIFYNYTNDQYIMKKFKLSLIAVTNFVKKKPPTASIYCIFKTFPWSFARRMASAGIGPLVKGKKMAIWPGKHHLPAMAQRQKGPWSRADRPAESTQRLRKRPSAPQGPAARPCHKKGGIDVRRHCTGLIYKEKIAAASDLPLFRAHHTRWANHGERPAIPFQMAVKEQHRRLGLHQNTPARKPMVSPILALYHGKYLI